MFVCVCVSVFLYVAVFIVYYIYTNYNSNPNPNPTTTTTTTTNSVLMKLYVIKEETKQHYDLVKEYKNQLENVRDKEVTLSHHIHDGKVDIAKDSKSLTLAEKDHSALGFLNKKR